MKAGAQPEQKTRPQCSQFSKPSKQLGQKYCSQPIQSWPAWDA
jgi:hypothetical protein